MEGRDSIAAGWVMADLKTRRHAMSAYSWENICCRLNEKAGLLCNEL